MCFRRLLVISDRPWHATMSLPEGAKKDFHTATYNERGGETVVNSFARKLAQKSSLRHHLSAPRPHHCQAPPPSYHQEGDVHGA